MPDGSAYKRKDGRWELQLIIGRDLNGKLIRKSFYGSGSREVKEKRDQWLEKQARNETLSKNIGFSEWSLKWLKIYKKGHVKENTYLYTYKVNIEKHINPYFGNTRLADIKQVDIQNFINSKSTMAQSCLKRFKVILNDIFDKAIDNELCYKNPCKSIDISSKRPEIKKQSYNQAQVNKIIKYAKTHKFGSMPIILLNTGLRRGELLGLTWDNVDMYNDIIHVVQQVMTVQRVTSITTLKTKSSLRDIPFNTDLHDYLCKLKQTSTSKYVIPGQDGDFMSSPTFNFRFKKFMEDMCENNLCIQKLTPHEMRHTFGTILREKGVDIYTIQKVLGHADIEITADIYVHNDINVLKKQMML